MKKTAIQFDPFVQVEQAESEVDIAKTALDAALRRYEWVIGKCRAEIETLRAERDAVELYSEEEFAKLLGVYDEKATRPVQYLATLRKQYNLPHRKIGQHTIYTREDVAECLEIFAIRGKGKQLAVSGKQLKRAA